MADTMFDPELMIVYEKIEKKTEREIFSALILAMAAFMPSFPTREFFGLCVSGVDDEVWMPQDIPAETRTFARNVMDGVMRQMLPNDPRKWLEAHPADYERDV